MKSPKLLTFLSALALASTASAVSTDPVGFVSVTVPANSDAVLAVPLNRAAEFKGVIQSISGNTITVAGTPAWTANAFAPGVTANKTYAVQIASGAKEGMIGRITANGVNTLTITLDSGDDLASIGTVAAPLDPDGAGPLAAQADQVDIMPFWTPSSLITSPPLATAILGFSNSGAGIDRGPGEVYAYDGSNWQDDVNGGVSNHVVLPFGSSFVLRNNSASTYSLSMVGSVPMTKFRVRISTLASNTPQDVQIGYMSPIPEPLTSLNFPAVTGDSILGFDNSEAGIDKAPISIYAFDGTKWVDDVNGGDVPTTVMLQPGIGYVFRKNQTPSPQSVVWTHLPSYLQ